VGGCTKPPLYKHYSTIQQKAQEEFSKGEYGPSFEHSISKIRKTIGLATKY